MQNKRYQVFVSSTFADLKDERRHVIETLLNLDCIPAGMEWFGAIDGEQFEYIKRVIDDCDYYVVIIGNRYGTLTAEGVSYTEKEYEYALSKGLKVAAFLHRNPGDLPAKYADDDPEAKAKLAAFRTKLEGKRLVEYWESADQLAGKVATSMSKMIKIHPAVGWVRANQVASIENLTEMNELRKANKDFERELAELRGGPKLEGIAGLDESVTIEGTYQQMEVRPGRGSTLGLPRKWKLSLTWKELFGAIAPEIMKAPHDEQAYKAFSDALFARTKQSGSNARLDRELFQTVKVQLMALGLIEGELKKTGLGASPLHWQLTSAGQRVMLETRAVRTALTPEGEQ